MKLINLIDVSQVKLLKGSESAAKSISYDHFGVFLAASGCDGQVRIWDTSAASTSTPIVALALIPKTNFDSECVSLSSWSSNGKFLAIPAETGIYVIRRPTWETCFKLNDNLEGASAYIASFSPNSAYLACATSSSKVLVYEIESKECIGYMDAKGIVTSISWSTHENSMLCSNNIGHVLRWDNVVPLHMNPPFKAEKKGLRRNGSEISQEPDDPESPKLQRKKLKKSKEITEEREVDVFSEDDFDNLYEDQFLDEYNDERKETQFEENLTGLAQSIPLQTPFQPGSTPSTGTKTILSWNLLGTVESHKLETHSLIHIQFSDVGFSKPIRFKDHFGFEVVSLGKRGAVFASKKIIESNPPSTLFFKPFETWTSNTEWRISLGDEHPHAVCIGNKWLSCVTSLNYVRIFSLSSQQIMIFSIPAPVVSAVGHDELLALVHHGSNPISDTQSLKYLLFDVESKKLLSSGPLPLTPGSKLKWIGFSENGVVSYVIKFSPLKN